MRRKQFRGGEARAPTLSATRPPRAQGNAAPPEAFSPPLLPKQSTARRAGARACGSEKSDCRRRPGCAEPARSLSGTIEEVSRCFGQHRAGGRLVAARHRRCDRHETHRLRSASQEHYGCMAAMRNMPRRPCASVHDTRLSELLPISRANSRITMRTRSGA